MSAGDHLNEQQFVDLYHRTNNPTPILEKGFNRGRDQGRVYFTDNPEGAYSTAYGPTVLHAKIPAHLPQLDDEFGDEKHYTVDYRDLKGVKIERWQK